MIYLVLIFFLGAIAYRLNSITNRIDKIESKLNPTREHDVYLDILKRDGKQIIIDPETGNPDIIASIMSGSKKKVKNK